MNLNDLAKQCLEISEQRKDLDESTVLDYLKHCSGEVLEASVAGNRFAEIKSLASDLSAIDLEEKWSGMEEPDTCEEAYLDYKNDFELELADIIICVLLVCAKEDIDIEQALKDAMKKNRARIK